MAPSPTEEREPLHDYAGAAAPAGGDRPPARDGARAGGKSEGAFRTISEVADDLDVAQHVLRFWESKFPQVRPLKRGGGRRYYRPEDVDVLRRIRALLYDEGYTIRGAQRLLRGRRPSPGPAPKTADGTRPSRHDLPDEPLAAQSHDHEDVADEILADRSDLPPASHTSLASSTSPAAPAAPAANAPRALQARSGTGAPEPQHPSSSSAPGTARASGQPTLSSGPVVPLAKAGSAEPAGPAPAVAMNRRPAAKTISGAASAMTERALLARALREELLDLQQLLERALTD